MNPFLVLGDPVWKRHINKEYKKWIKNYPCLICEQSPVDVHHVRRASAKGPNDYMCVPLCREHHREYHDSEGKPGEFQKKYSLNFDWIIINLLSIYIDDANK